MRFLVIILSILITSGSSWAQEYQVLHVVGEIQKVSDGTLLKKGETLNSDTEIKFITSDAKAAVLSTEMGRYILKPSEEEETQSDLVYVIKTAVFPVKGGMSTRGIIIANELELIYYFTEAPYVWVGDLLSIRIFKSAFQMSEDHYFYVRYTYEDSTYHKRISYDQDIMIFDKSELFTINEKRIDPNEVEGFRLNYFYKEEDVFNYNLICDIEFVYLTEEDVQSMFDELKETSKYPYNEMADILSDLYGKSDPIQLRQNLN